MAIAISNESKTVTKDNVYPRLKCEVL